MLQYQLVRLIFGINICNIIAVTVHKGNIKPPFTIVKSEPFNNQMTCEPHNYHEYSSTNAHLRN